MMTTQTERELLPQEKGEPWRLQPGEQFRYQGVWLTVTKENQRHGDGHAVIFGRESDEQPERSFLVEINVRTWVRRYEALKPTVTKAEDWV